MHDDTTAAPAPGAATDTSVQSTPAETPTATTPAATPPPPEPVRKPIEQWQLEKGVLPWLFSFACTQNRWPQGRELTEAEFVAAIQAAFEIAFR